MGDVSRGREYARCEIYRRNGRRRRLVAEELLADTGTMQTTGMRTTGGAGGGGGSPSTHLVVLYVATAGLQGNALGSDEEEITLLVYVLIDVLQNKVRM